MEDNIYKEALKTLKKKNKENKPNDLISSKRKELPKLTNDETLFLKILNPKWEWIVKDKDGSIEICTDYPIKDTEYGFMWYGGEDNEFIDFLPKDMFSFVKWEDKEPYSIKELLNGGQK